MPIIRPSIRRRCVAAALGGAALAMTLHHQTVAAAGLAPDATPLLYVCLSVEEERWICEGTPSPTQPGGAQPDRIPT